MENSSIWIYASEDVPATTITYFSKKNCFTNSAGMPFVLIDLRVP